MKIKLVNTTTLLMFFAFLSCNQSEKKEEKSESLKCQPQPLVEVKHIIKSMCVNLYVITLVLRKYLVLRNKISL